MLVGDVQRASLRGSRWPMTNSHRHPAQVPGSQILDCSVAGNLARLPDVWVAVKAVPRLGSDLDDRFMQVHERWCGLDAEHDMAAGRALNGDPGDVGRSAAASQPDDLTTG